MRSNGSPDIHHAIAAFIPLVKIYRTAHMAPKVSP